MKSTCQKNNNSDCYLLMTATVPIALHFYNVFQSTLDLFTANFLKVTTAL